MHDDLTRHLGNEALWLVMYKIRYFLMLKYFMKYFGNISVFNEIFQNAMPFCTSCLFLPRGVMAQNLMMLNACNCLLLVKYFLLLTSTDYL